LSSRKIENEAMAIKYSAGLPTIFCDRFYKVRAQSCSPVDDDQQSSASSNSCSPPLIFQRSRYHRSYPAKVGGSKETATCRDLETNVTSNSFAPSEEIFERKLHLNGCVSDIATEKGGNALAIMSHESSSLEHSLAPSDKNGQFKIRMNVVGIPTDVKSQIDNSACPEVLFEGDTVEETYNVVPSSPIRLRSHTRIHAEDDILKKKIQNASRVGITKKVRTTEEIVQDMTMVRLPTLDQTEKEILHSSSSNNHSQVTTKETENTYSSVKNDISSLCVEVEASGARSISNNYDLETNEKVIEKTAEEEILARLPYIDAPKILAEMQAEIDNEVSEPCYSRKTLIPEQSSVFSDNILSKNDQIMDGITGNYSFDGKFKRWNENVSKHSYDNHLLLILPYTVID